jgi:hypothetical protein
MSRLIKQFMNGRSVVINGEKCKILDQDEEFFFVETEMQELDNFGKLVFSGKVFKRLINKKGSIVTILDRRKKDEL